MRNAGLEEAQAGIKIAGRNINKLRYAADTTLMAESEEELESLLMKVKVDSEKAGLKLNIQKMKIILPNHPTLALSHRVQKTVLYFCVSFAVLHIGLLLHLSKLHIYALVYCIDVFLSGLLHSV